MSEYPLPFQLYLADGALFFVISCGNPMSSEPLGQICYHCNDDPNMGQCSLETWRVLNPVLVEKVDDIPEDLREMAQRCLIEEREDYDEPVL